MRRLKIDGWRDVVFERVFPARDADAPAIARFEPGESPFTMRCHQIVAIEHGEIQKLAGRLHADRVLPDIFSAGATITIAIKPSHRIAAAGS